MADQTLELLIQLRNETQAGFAQLNGSLKQAGEKAQEAGGAFERMKGNVVGLVAGFVTFRAALDLITSSLKAQAEQEDSINKLNLALANQGNFTKETSQALQDYADELQRTTTFSDDAVLSAQAVLASFGMNEEQIKRTTKAAADFAAATKTDLTTASELLGKAFAGNTAALSRYGIIVDESIPKSERFAVAMEQLEQRFKGSAEAATATAIGGFAQLKNAAGEVQEGIGKLIGELFDSQQGFNVAIEGANRLATFIKVDLVLALSEARAKFAEMMASLLEIMAKVTGAFNDFADKIGANSGKLALIVRATTGLDLALDTSKLKAAAEDQIKLAAAIRESGNQSAMQAGKIRDVTNATNVHRRAISEGGEAMKRAKKDAEALWDFQIQTAKLAQKASEEFFREQERQASENAKKILEGLEAEREAREALDERRKDMAARAEAEIQANRDAALALADALFEAGEAFGGLFGGILQLGAGAIDVMLALGNQAVTTREKILATANAINAAASAFQGGSVFGGAMGGAAAGAAFGPLGAGIGAVAGGLLGLFGGAKKAREELAKLRQQVIGSFGSMEQFRKTAQNLGIDVSRAFSTKSPEEFKKIVDQVNKAAEEQKARIEGIRTAMSGLQLMTEGFAMQMERSGIATAASQAAFQRLGLFAVATFSAMVRETGDVIGALQQMGGSLNALIKAQQDFGLTASASLQRLLGLQAVITQHEDLAKQIQGLNQLMTGLGEANQITRELFIAFGQDAAAQFAELQARGVDANTSMALMQPTLQQLWEEQKRFGTITDEATAALLRQAEEQGIVGDHMRSVNEQILEVLLAIGEVLGAAIPDALRRMGDTAQEQFDRMQESADAASRSIASIPHADFVERHDTGGGAAASSASSTGGGGSARGGGGVTQVNLHMDSQKVGEVLIRRNRAGHLPLRR